jgi:hypothetical protein
MGEDIEALLDEIAQDWRESLKAYMQYAFGPEPVARDVHLELERITRKMPSRMASEMAFRTRQRRIKQ